MELKLTFFDFEVFKQDWFVSFLEDDTNTYVTFKNDELGLIDYLERHKNDTCFIGYNNKHFDNYCIKAIYNGINPYRVVDWVIKKGNVPWTLPEFKYKKTIDLITFDVMTEIPGVLSLKDSEANLGKNIEEMDFDNEFGGKLTDEDYARLLEYNKWDVYSTKLTFEFEDAKHRCIKTNYEAKKELIEMFKLSYDNLCKSFPLLAATIFDCSRTGIDQPDEYHYKTPNCLNKIENKDIIKQYEDHIQLWKDDFSFSKKLKDMEVEFAVGGLHGAIENYIKNTTEDYVIMTADVESLYPHLLHNKANAEFNFLSKAIRNPEIFGQIKEDRLKAKHNGEDKKARALKLLINSIYGAQLQSYGDGRAGPLTDWVNGRNVCITGQLCLWYLTELVSKLPNCEVFNLNTDGIYLYTHKDNIKELETIFENWQKELGLKLEISTIKNGAIYQKDVNNYILYDKNLDSIKTKGREVNKWKGGSFSNNTASIIDEAIVKYFVYGKPINETVDEAYVKNQGIKFQVILSRKGKNFTESYWGNQIINKTNRVFPTTNENCPEVTKLKNGTKYSFPDAPKHAYLFNKDVSQIKLDEIDLDIMYYLNLINKKIKHFIKK